ncbi:MAG: ATP synthase subunit b [Desulfovibrio sp.]
MRHAKITILSLAFVFGASGVAFAAGDGHGLPWKDFFFRIATAALVVGIIWKFAGKLIAEWFSNRRSGIAQELDDLEARKENARQALMDVEKRIANLEKERMAILAEYETRGEALKAEIIAKAEDTAAQIVTQAKQTAQNEIDKALVSMREELAEQITDAAGKALAGSLSAKDHEKLLNGFLNKVVLQ